MTIKEIAELCGVTEQTIRNWTHKVSDDPAKNLQGLVEKLSEAEKSGKEAADFTLDETLAIIGEGGGNKVLASLLAENARNKDALAVQNAPPAIAGILANFERIMERTKALIERQSSLPEDPKKAAYEELEKFVQDNLETDPKRIHTVSVWQIYHAYEKIADHPLSEHEVMYKIALDHPEFELTRKHRDWVFIRCQAKRFL